MIPTIFNLERRLNFKKRAKKHQQSHDFLHKEVFFNHLERLSMILQDMPSITFIDVPDYFLEFPETIAFLNLKKTTKVNNITRDSEIFPNTLSNQNAVVALLTCHTVNDLVGYFIQIKNSLHEDGVLIASFFGENSATVLKNAFANAELDLSNTYNNRFHPVSDIKTLGGLLQRAGFTIPVADAEDYNVHYKDLTSLIADLKGMGESNCLTHLSKPLTQSIYQQALINLDTALPDHILNIDIITLTGRRPSEAQQKPLKRGSAQVSLKQVLE
jgi:hypothetical protein